MDDLVQHVVRELSFEGDLGERFVLHLIGIGDRPGPRDFPIMCGRRGSTLVVAFLFF